jgi:hypothetical protein
MARRIVVNDNGTSLYPYRGIQSFWNYTNRDSSEHTNQCCGQAAVYSINRTRHNTEAEGGLTNFVRKYPPDVFFGTLGSSKERIIEMLHAVRFRFRTDTFSGLDGSLHNNPVIVCLDVNAAGLGGMGLHWVSIFGYTQSYYYLSNWENNRITRDQLFKGVTAPLTNLSNTNGRIYIPY